MTAASVQTPPTPGLTDDQRVFAIVFAVLLLAGIIELVRRRKLREEYSVLWTVTAGFVLLLAWRHVDLLDVLRSVTGIVEPTSALFFGSLLFLMGICLQFSVRLSKLTVRNRMLGQRVALLEQELAALRDGIKSDENPSSR